MRSRLRADAVAGFLGVLPAAATAAAEGAWIAVAYAALQIGLAQGTAELGVPAFVGAAGAGLVMARRASRRGPGKRPGTSRMRGRTNSAGPQAVFVGTAVVAMGLLGWLADGEVRAGLMAGTWGSALGAHAPGWLLALAFWRGLAHSDPREDDAAVGSLLARVVPGLAIPWIVGGVAAGSRLAFASYALPATLLFVAAGLVAVGVTRMDALGKEVGLDWRRNRAWLTLLISVVVLVVALGLPAALLLGVALDALPRTILGPLAALVALPIETVAGVVSALGLAPPSGPGADGGGHLSLPAIPGWVVAAVAVIVLGSVLAGLLVAAARARGGRPAMEWRAPRDEDRAIVLPTISLGLPRPRLPRFTRRRAPTPHTASDAYLTLLEEIHVDPVFARRPNESPALHARRLRAAGAGALSLDLLAADFQLERYAAARLTSLEVLRAIRRWRSLRRWPRVPAAARGEADR